MFRYMSLILANTLRNRRSSALTMASIAIALCLMTVMAASYRALFGAPEADPQEALRLMTHHSQPRCPASNGADDSSGNGPDCIRPIGVVSPGKRPPEYVESTSNRLNILVLRKGSTSELSSAMTRETFQDLLFKPGI